MNKRLPWIIISVFWFFVIGFSIEENVDKGKVSIDFQPVFLGQKLVLEHQLYQSSNGDSLYLDKLRFYVSGIQLKGKRLIFSQNDSCHLIDADENGCLHINIKDVPAGKYDTLRFCIGTDSLINVSGAQGGDLDPTNGMYWTWNSGYINVKIEGRSNSCPTLHHAFEFHLGGYLPPHPTLRVVVLPVQIQVKASTTTSIEVEADLAKFFDRFDLRKTNQVMIPGKTAAQMADYFQGIFKVK